jgi:RNA polymerase sigma-70 factor (ECF subfamily)
LDRLNVQNGKRDHVGARLPIAGRPVIRISRWSGAPGAPTGGQEPVGDERPADDDPAEIDDATLVERARTDADAFGYLYDRYCEAIYRFVYRRLGEREAAEDVTADVFFKALRAIDSYRPQTAPFSAWLYRIAQNAVIDHLRVRKVTLSLDLAEDRPDRADPVEEQAINRVEAARVWDAVDQLTEAQRTAVLLRLGHDLPLADIAERMDRSVGAVKLLLNRGLAAVRVQLQPPAEGQEAPQ